MIYGQVKKQYRRRRLVGVTHVMRCGTRLALCDALMGLGLSGKLNTAFVERLKEDDAAERGGLGAGRGPQPRKCCSCCCIWSCGAPSYHFVRQHESFRVGLAQPRQRGGKRQPQRYPQRRVAMAAGLTHRRWMMREVLLMPLLPEPIGVAGV